MTSSPNVMNVLIVGGVADGKRIVLAAGDTRISMAVSKPINSIAALSEAPADYETQHYNLFSVQPVTRLVIFALESLTSIEVMERLLEGYRPIPKRSQS